MILYQLPPASFPVIWTVVAGARTVSVGLDEDGCARTLTCVDVVPGSGAAVGVSAPCAAVDVTAIVVVGDGVEVMRRGAGGFCAGVEGMAAQPPVPTPNAIMNPMSIRLCCTPGFYTFPCKL